MEKAKRVPKFSTHKWILGDVCSAAVSYLHAASSPFLLLQIFFYIETVTESFSVG